MPFFAVFYTYADDPDAVAAARPGHRAYLRSLVDAGSLRASGPFPGARPDSALLIFTAADRGAVEALLENDPIAPLVASVEIKEWNPLLGVFADEVTA